MTADHGYCMMCGYKEIFGEYPGVTAGGPRSAPVWLQC